MSNLVIEPSQVINFLRDSLHDERPEIREGVCYGLGEVLTAATRGQLISYSEIILPAIREALADKVGAVQEAAAQAFDVLYTNVGSKALDEILPPMLQHLDDPDSTVSNMALNGLRQMLAVRSNIGAFPSPLLFTHSASLALSLRHHVCYPLCCPFNRSLEFS